jgi:type IV secretory pathway VirB3-like protein
MVIIVLVAFGVAALTRGADVLGIALLAAGAVVVAALAWLVAMRRRAS